MSTDNTTLIVAMAGARLAPRSESRVLRLIRFFAGLVGAASIMDEYWTTLGRTIYYPDSVPDPLMRQYRWTVEHELVHVAQWEKWGFWFLFSYLFLPVPFFFAWFRWRWEREAYMVQIRSGEATPRECADALLAYGRPWPHGWMVEWFRREAGRMYE